MAGPSLQLDARVFLNGPPVNEQPQVANWQLTTDNATETVWTTPVAPFGPFDYIGLHRFKPAQPNGKVIVFAPGATANGELYTDDESADFRLYLAHRGYDVYSLDYRTHFIDPLPDDLSSLNHWDSSHFVSDLHLAVQQAERVSRVERVYLAAFSSGNEFMYYYAALYGREEIKALVGMDGGPWQVGSLAPPRTVDFNQGLQALQGGDTPANRALLEGWNVPPGPGPYFAGGNLLPDLSGLPPYQGDEDPLTFLLQNLWGDGQLTNIENGYNTLDRLVPFMLIATDEFWPNVQTLEDVTTSNYDGRPPTLHYLDHFGQVDLPMLIFGSGELTSFDYTELRWKFLAPQLCRTTDYQTVLLDGFGHLDVLTGTQAQARVFAPMEAWLRQR